MGEIEFVPFKVTTKRRYWEDEGFGIMVKRDVEYTVYNRQFRSSSLKFAIMRGDVLLIEGEKCVFGFKGRILSIVGGKDKNLITIIGEDGKKVNKEYISKSTKENVGKALSPKRPGVIVVDKPATIKITKPKKKSKKQ